MKVLLSEALFAPACLANHSLSIVALFQVVGLNVRHAVILDFDSENSACYADWRLNRLPFEREAVDAAVRAGVQADARQLFDNVVRVADIPESEWNKALPELTPPDAV